jgi:type I restriction enzyme R subunit
VLFPRFHQWHAVRSILEPPTPTGRGWTGWSCTRPGRASRTRSRGPRTPSPACTAPMTADLRQGRRHHRPQGARPAAAGHGRRVGAHPGHDRADRPALGTAQGGAGRQRGPGHHHDPAEVPGRGQARHRGSSRGASRRRAWWGAGSRSSSTRRTPRPPGGRDQAQDRPARRTGASEEDAAAAEADESDLDDETGGPEAALWASALARGKHEEPVVLRVHRDPETQDAGDVRADRRGPGRASSGRSTRTRCARRSRRGSSSTCWRTTRRTAVYYKLANAHPRNDPELETRKGRAALARFASLHPYELDAKAEVIIEHFRQKTAGQDRRPRQGDGRDPLAAARGADASRRWMQYISRSKGYDHGGACRCKTLVAFSGTVIDPDAPDLQWTEAGMNGFSESGSCRSGSSDEFRCSSWPRSTRPGSTSRCCTRCTSTRSSPGSRPCRPSPGSTAPSRQGGHVRPRLRQHGRGDPGGVRAVLRAVPGQPDRPQHPYTMSRPRCAAGVLSAEEMDAAVAALLSEDPARQGVIYANLGPAVGRFIGARGGARGGVSGHAAALLPGVCVHRPDHAVHRHRP